MLRIKLDALTVQDGRYLYQNSVFNGVAYGPDQGTTLAALQVVDGTLAGPYQSPYLGTVLRTACVDVTGFTEDDIDDHDADAWDNGAGLSYVADRTGLRLLHEGQPFNGLACEFIQSFCVREIGYRDGHPIADAQWTPDGRLVQLLLDQEVNECYSWHPDGKPETAWINQVRVHEDRGAERLFHLALEFAPTGGLRSVEVQGDLDRLAAALATRTYFPIKRLDQLGELAASERFMLFNDAFQFSWFADMARRDAFKHTEELWAPAAFVAGEEGQTLVANMRALRKLVLRPGGGDEAALARALQARRPDLEVQVPRQVGDHPDEIEYVPVSSAGR